MRLLLIIGMLLGATSALASDRAEWNPPARFDHAYSGELTLTQMPQKRVFSVCMAMFRKNKIPAASFTGRGCAIITSPGHCKIIYIDRPYRGTEPSAVLRHELGHCNGWQANHPE